MDLTRMIVDLLRKKEENAALSKGGPVAGVTPTPTPDMLGSGGAALAAEALLKQKSKPMKYVDSL